jgi:hypothetical protein
MMNGTVLNSFAIGNGNEYPFILCPGSGQTGIEAQSIRLESASMIVIVSQPSIFKGNGENSFGESVSSFGGTFLQTCNLTYPTGQIRYYAQTKKARVNVLVSGFQMLYQ